MMSVTRFTEPTISSIVLPASFTSLVPPSTLCTESVMSSLISLAAAALRWARVRIKFNLTQASYDQFTVVIILNVADRVVGMVVDGVSDVIALGADQIRPAPEFSSTFDTRYITGLGTVAERMLILVDMEKLVTGEEMALLDSTRH